MPPDIAAFLGVATLVIVTPGQDTALTVRNTLAGGRRGGIFTALGVVTGQASWALATSAGITGLLLASEPAFRALKLAGAAYLVLLGAQAMRDALSRRRETATLAREPALRPWPRVVYALVVERPATSCDSLASAACSTPPRESSWSVSACGSPSRRRSELPR